MISNNPITTEDGRVFDRRNISLVIATRVENGAFTASVACRIIPMLITEDGAAETLEDQADSLVIGDTATVPENTPERDAIGAIYAAVQEYILSKGL